MVIKMRIDAWAESDVGMKRSTNQDSFLVRQDLGLFVVADGMGGHSGGEVASKMAVDILEEVIAQAVQAKGYERPADVLERAYAEASGRIYARTQVQNPELKGMGTTVVAVWIRDGVAYIGNVGDSRAYLFHAPDLWQITEDHSFVAEQIRAGLLKQENVHRFSARNVITRSVGYEQKVEVDIIERKLEPGEMILLCSDGLTGQVADHRLVEILRTVEPSKVVFQMVEEAKQNGGDDNVTALLIRANGSF
jgi:serine/threonine protein phosphatase PrpC